jgi:hypothetical protein
VSEKSDLETKIASSSRASFGSGVSEEVIHDAELVLGVRFPRSYRWWLGRYGHGYLATYELQGLAPTKPSERDPDEVLLGDVVWTALNNRSRGEAPYLLELLNYEGDEIYYLDLSQADEGEAPVVVRVPHAESLNLVAESFQKFLEIEL